MAFTGLTKYGFTDGEQIGNWGDKYPLFIRIKANELPYAVAREDNAGHPTPGRFGSVFFTSREWLRNTIFGANKSDADLFADKPNNTQDTSEPGSSFVLKDNTTLLLRRPDTGATTTPVVTNPTNNTPPNQVPTTQVPTTQTPTTQVPTGNLTGTPTTTTSTTTTVAAATTMTPTVKWAIIGVAVAIVGGILYMVMKGGSANGSRRGNGRRY